MTPIRLIWTAIIVLTMSACAVTGPADDGFENSLESVDIGKIQANDLLEQLYKKPQKQ